MTYRQDPPQHHAYILRFWETRSRPPDHETWRFSLENLGTEEAYRFPDLTSLTDFLRTRMGEEGSSYRGGSTPTGGRSAALDVEQAHQQAEDGGQGIAQPGNGRERGSRAAETDPVGEIEASILLVEKDSAIRRSVRDWLEGLLPNCPISEAGSGAEAVAVARARSPEVILVDVAPPTAEGLQTLRNLSDSAPTAQIVALTMGDGPAQRNAVLSEGASASLAIWRMREALVPTLKGLLTAKRPTMDGKTVVCIEDEPDIIDLIQLALAQHGVNLVGVLGGREGLDAIRQLKPDLVLLDLMMPDIDGWQVYQRMKADEALRDIPVMVITVLDPYWSAKQGLDLSGVHGYVTKPFVPQELARRVNAALRVVA